MDTENKNVLRRYTPRGDDFWAAASFRSRSYARVILKITRAQRSGSAAKTRHNREVTPDAQSHRLADTNLLDLFVYTVRTPSRLNLDDALIVTALFIMRINLSGLIHAS